MGLKKESQEEAVRQSLALGKSFLDKSLTPKQVGRKNLEKLAICIGVTLTKLNRHFPPEHFDRDLGYTLGEADEKYLAALVFYDLDIKRPNNHN